MKTEQSKPVRVQRKRIKGFRLQDTSPDGREVVSVTRPGRWGNPFTVEQYGSLAVSVYERWLNGYQVPGAPCPPQLADLIGALAGKHLACFCPAGAHCHADVLLKLANLSLEELGQRYQQAHAHWRNNKADNAAGAALTRASEALLAHPDNNGAYHP